MRLRGVKRAFFTEVDAIVYRSQCDWFRKVQESLRPVLVRVLGASARLDVEARGVKFFCWAAGHAGSEGKEA